MKGCATLLGCFTSIVVFVFFVAFIIQFPLMLFRGEPITAKAVGMIVDDALLGGFFLATPICICVASDRWEHHKKMKAIRRKLMARQPQSDIEFCRDISEIDRQLAVELRQRLAEAQDVPTENLYATDKLVEDLGASDSFEDLYEEALGGRNIFEVATDEVLDIVDKPDRTLQECAEEIRLLTAWTARELDRQTPDGTSESQLPT
ncbi:MAG: hypothetical protein ACI8P0_003986 [Planctomycetaceae bacterium]|jgi:hypothetical protein